MRFIGSGVCGLGGGEVGASHATCAVFVADKRAKILRIMNRGMTLFS